MQLSIVWRRFASAAALTAAAIVMSSPSQSAKATPPPPGPKVTMLGDSTMAATIRYGTNAALQRRFAADVDALSCRGITRSCGRTSVPTTVMEEMARRRGRIGDALVIMAGYDDQNLAFGVDSVMNEAKAQGLSRVIWLTYRTTTTYLLPNKQSAAGLYESHNRILAAKADQYPALRIIDWDGFTKSQCNQPRGAKTSCWFAADGIHMTPAGATGLTTWLEQQLTTLLPSRCWTGERVGDAPTALAGAAARATPGGYTPARDVRLLDTRESDADDPGHRTPLASATHLAFDLPSATPADVTAAAVNVSAVDPCQDGFLTAYACDDGLAPTSTVNFLVDRSSSNSAIVRVGASKQLCVYSSADTDVIVDLTGWFTTTGSPFATASPTRLVDTRSAGAARLNVNGRRGAGSTTKIEFAGVAPNGVTAGWIAVVAVNPAHTGVVSLHSCDDPAVSATIYVRPDTFSGRIVANAAIVDTDRGGLCVSTTVDTDLVIDGFGWFGPAGSLHLTMSSAERLLDTRNPPAALAPLAPTSLKLTGAVDVINLTAVQPNGNGYITVHPCGALPNVSNLNTSVGVDRPVMALIAPGDNGLACITSSTGTNVVVDRLGSFS
jgi:hypothetical protein